MKKQVLRFLARIIGVVIISIAVNGIVYAYPSGSPAGYSGSPGDGQNCKNCHGGSTATVSGWITSDIPPAGYTAGATYTITATVSGSGKKGLEVSPQSVSGTQLGILIAGSNNHLVGGTKYVTQNSSGSTSSTVIYTFTWTAPVAGTGTVTFYGAFTVGKSNTKLSTLVVNENAVLPLAVSVTANPTTILLGASSQLTAAPSGGSGTYTYSWTSVPAGFTSTQQNPLVSPTVTTQYVVAVNDGSGSVQGNSTVTVTIPAPLAVSVSATPSAIMSGQSSQLNASASGGTGSYTYTWSSVPAGFTSTSQNPLVWPTATTQYNVTVSDGSGTVQGSATVTVTASPLTATATATPAVVCAGQSVQLNVIPAGGSGTYTYSWTSVPAGFSSTLQNPVVTPAVSTQYIAHVSDGVGSAESTTSVTVNQPATAAAGNDTTCGFGTNQVPLFGTAANYTSTLWTTSGTGTFSAANALTGNYLPSAADKTGGNVSLTLTTTPLSPCSTSESDTRIIHFDATIGIADAQNARISMTISPNPSAGLFKLSLGGKESRNVTVTVSEITGRPIIQRSFDTSLVNPMHIDLSGYPRGLYLVKVQTDGQSVIRKIVIE